jgi:predicted GNAT family acetyltransferase
VEVPDGSVTDNAAERRYEFVVDGSLFGFLSYRDRRDARVLVHTEVDPVHQSKGVGSRLVEAALEDIRARGVELVPLCPFVRAYLRDHPEQADLVAARAR